MKNLRKRFERFCLRNSSKGIPNLMLYICVGNAIVYLVSMMAGNYTLYNLLCFHRASILHGQIWRLFTYPLTMSSSNVLLMAIGLFCYYSIGSSMERQWGTLKFNLFYLTGVVLTDLYALLFGCNASVYYLNTSLFLSFATMYPQASFLLFFVIPIKAWFFALLDLAIILLGLFSPPYTAANLLPLIALANYFLFFGSDVLNLIPPSWQYWFRKNLGRKTPPAQSAPKVIPFAPASSESPKPQKAYNHRCTVCGRTDVSNPELEFRYCSRCNGFYCYCSDHINNHSHIQ